MRILFIVPYMPNAIRTRPYNLLRALARNGHELTLLTLAQNAAEMDDAEALRSWGIRVVARPLSRARSLANSAAALAGQEPLQAAYCWQPALAADLTTLLRGEAFDVVHVEHLRGARYGRLARAEIATSSSRTPVIWDSVDCISHLFRQASVHSASRFGRAIARLELPRTERFEGQLLGEFDQILATSPVDREALAQLGNGRAVASAPIRVLPNGVDTDTFRPGAFEDREPDTLILSGKMSYHANVTMAQFLVKQVMPRIWARDPAVKVLLVGKDPAAEVRGLGRDPRVTVTGTVPDMQTFMRRATIALAPIVYSAGIQNKILEAMACGAPVVTTPAAIAGLDVRPGEHLLVADGAAEMADVALCLLNSPERRQALSSAGLAYVREHHSWLTIAQRLALIYDSR